MHSIAKSGTKNNWRPGLLRLIRPNELAQHLSVVNEADREFIELCLAVGETWARPVEDIVLETEGCADSPYGGGNRKRLVLNEQIC